MIDLLLKYYWGNHFIIMQTFQNNNNNINKNKKKTNKQKTKTKTKNKKTGQQMENKFECSYRPIVLLITWQKVKVRMAESESENLCLFFVYGSDKLDKFVYHITCIYAYTSELKLQRSNSCRTSICLNK